VFADTAGRLSLFELKQATNQFAKNVGIQTHTDPAPFRSIGHPELIDASQFHAAGEIQMDLQLVFGWW
jgi:hypothetical protein